MAGFPSRWKSILKEEQNKVKDGSPFSEYQKAAKRASARYHGKEASNPPGGGLMKLAIIGGTAYLGLRMLSGGVGNTTTSCACAGHCDSCATTCEHKGASTTSAMGV
jgi:hypothetical protein